MALIWQKRHEDTDYQVVTAGESVRLYRNRVLHSQWNPNNPVKGRLWELFLLTSFIRGKNITRVLVLGAGGGAVINLIHRYFPDAIVDAIELDRTHIYIAKKYFKVSAKKCNLIHADAFEWMDKSPTRAYDLIVDDVFYEAGQVPFRSIKANGRWLKGLKNYLHEQGILVINFADKSEWNTCRSLSATQKSLKNYEIGVAMHKQCQNRIVHIAKQSLSATMVKSSLQASECKAYLRHWSKGDFSYRRLQ